MNNKAIWWIGGVSDDHISDVGTIDYGVSCIDDYEKQTYLGCVSMLGDGLTGSIDYELIIGQIGDNIGFGNSIGRIG